MVLVLLQLSNIAVHLKVHMQYKCVTFVMTMCQFSPQFVLMMCTISSNAIVAWHCFMFYL